jgi:WD40 repeat protein
MQSVVPISTHSRAIQPRFCLLHSHQMAHKLCLDPSTRLFDCGMQSVVPISTHSRAIPTSSVCCILTRWQTNCVWIQRQDSSTVGCSQWCPSQHTQGPFSHVQSVAFSPDGTQIVSGSYDNTLRLWDAVSGAHLNTLKGHSKPQFVCCILARWHNKLCLDPTTRLFDCGMQSVVPISTHSRAIQTQVQSVAFSPDGNTNCVWILLTRLFDCGMQSVVPISTHSRAIPTGFCLLHSHQMAHKLCLDP